MGVPASGQLKLYSDIYTEFTDHSQGNNSLHSASIYAGFTTPDAMSDFYGYQDQVPPTLTTCTAAGVTCTAMQLRGAVNNLGGAPNVARGFRFGPYSNINSNPQYLNSNSAGTGAYTDDRTGLASTSTYYFQAYATNDAGTGVGATCSATTQTPWNCTLCSAAQSPGFTAMAISINNNVINGGGPWHAADVTTYYQHPYNGWTGLTSVSCGPYAPSAQCRQVEMNESAWIQSPTVCHRMTNNGRQGPSGWSNNQQGCKTAWMMMTYGCFYVNGTWQASSNPSTTDYYNENFYVCFCLCTDGYAYNHTATKYRCFSDLRLKTNINYL